MHLIRLLLNPDISSLENDVDLFYIIACEYTSFN